MRNPAPDIIGSLRRLGRFHGTISGFQTLRGENETLRGDRFQTNPTCRRGDPSAVAWNGLGITCRIRDRTLGRSGSSFPRSRVGMVLVPLRGGLGCKFGK